MEKRIIVVCGPTAVGKTKIAVELASTFGTAVLSFDSRQCYRELNIGVAKPTQQELTAVPHYFINSHSITETLNAAVFERFALKTLERLFEKHDTVIAAGGTGLYLDALCKGMDDIPSVPEAVRQTLQQEYEANGIGWLKKEIQQTDKHFTGNNDLHNAQRMLRALEVFRHTGNSIRYYHTKPEAKRPFAVVRFGIELEREQLYKQINNRVLEMMENGLLEEVRHLKAFEKYNALQTVGYKELFSFLNGQLKLPEAILQIQQHTRNYAKRQLTWFKKDASITWLHPENGSEKIRSRFSD
jgi:tRNA dimethylallyltransferase